MRLLDLCHIDCTRVWVHGYGCTDMGMAAQNSTELRSVAQLDPRRTAACVLTPLSLHGKCHTVAVKSVIAIVALDCDAYLLSIVV